MENHPVILRIGHDVDVIIEDVGLLRRVNIVVGEEPRVAFKIFVDLGLSSYLKAVILILLLVAGEHKAEFEVLLVRHLFCAEDETTVEFPDTLIHLTVLLEELQLHGVALSIIDSACCNQIIYLHICGLIELSRLLGSAAHEVGQGKLGELSDHYSFLFYC